MYVQRVRRRVTRNRDGRCLDDDSDDSDDDEIKVLVCHTDNSDASDDDGGNDDNVPETICIEIDVDEIGTEDDEVAEHLAHGDHLGTCGISDPCTSAKTGYAQEIASIDPKSSIKLEAYPNPFTNSTFVRFSIPYDGEVILDVFNVTGTEVASLFNGSTEGNREYSIELNAANFPVGFYIIRLRIASSKIHYKKIIVY